MFESTFGSEGDSPIVIVWHGGYSHFYNSRVLIDNFVFVCPRRTLKSVANYKIGGTPLRWDNGTYALASDYIRGGARNEACIALQQNCSKYEEDMEAALSSDLKLLVAGKRFDRWLFTHFS